MKPPARKSRPPSPFVILLTLFTVVAGCGHLPLGPLRNQPGTYTNPKFAAVPSPPTGQFGAVGTGPLSGSSVIDGTQGGVLTVGRFTVTVPAGAFQDTATISISIADQSIVECNLSITPAAANSFHLPVSLAADCSGVTNVDLKNCGTLWYDPQAGVWRTVTGAVVDLSASTVTASLMHFSTYGVADLVDGRASW